MHFIWIPISSIYHIQLSAATDVIVGRFFGDTRMHFIFYVGNFTISSSLRLPLFLTICSRLLLSFENLCDHLVWSISFTFAHNSTCIYFEFLLTITVQCAMCMQMQINFYVCISSYRSLSLLSLCILYTKSIYFAATYNAGKLELFAIKHLVCATGAWRFSSLFFVILFFFLLLLLFAVRFYCALVLCISVHKKRDSKQKKTHLSKINDRLKV